MNIKENKIEYPKDYLTAMVFLGIFSFILMSIGIFFFSILKWRWGLPVMIIGCPVFILSVCCFVKCINYRRKKRKMIKNWFNYLNPFLCINPFSYWLTEDLMVYFMLTQSNKDKDKEDEN